MFIDEIDAFGRRSDGGGNTDYTNKVVATLLELFEGAEPRDGVVIVGATNFPELVDPALLRPGRLGRRIHIGLPEAPQIAGILRHHLGTDLADTDRDTLARRLAGLTAADLAGLVRDARRTARRVGRGLEAGDLTRAATGLRPPVPQRQRHRIAAHEAGHAVVHTALGLPLPRLVRYAAGGGEMIASAPPAAITAGDLHRQLVSRLAGRAAERCVLGTISAGAGGDDPTCDLARATDLAVAIETRIGLGATGPLWLAPSAATTAFAAIGGLATRVRSRLDAAEADAMRLVERHVDAVTALATKIMAEETVEGVALHAILRRVIDGSGAQDDLEPMI